MTLEQSYRSRVVFLSLGILGVFAFVSDDDYHKMFDKPQEVRYNCDMLIGSWHPDVPQNVIEECRKMRNAKTY